MAARARLMPNHAIGIGDLPQRAALVAGLAAARLARAAAQAARDARLLLQPVARRRLGAVRAVLPQLSAKVRHFSLKRRDPPSQRGDQLFDFGRENHPTLDSDSSPAVSKNPPTKPLSTPPVTFRTHSGLGVTIFARIVRNARNSLHFSLTWGVSGQGVIFISAFRVLLWVWIRSVSPFFRHAALMAASPHIRSSLSSDHNPSCSRASGSGWRDHPVERHVSAKGKHRSPPARIRRSQYSASLEWVEWVKPPSGWIEPSLERDEPLDHAALSSAPSGTTPWVT